MRELIVASRRSNSRALPVDFVPPALRGTFCACRGPWVEGVHAPSGRVPTARCPKRCLHEAVLTPNGSVTMLIAMSSRTTTGRASLLDEPHWGPLDRLLGDDRLVGGFMAMFVVDPRGGTRLYAYKQ